MFDKRKDNEPAAESTAFGNPPENRQRTPENQVRGTAMIGKTITIKGDITGEENLVIEGKVDGSVQLKNNDLTVGQSGRVTANIQANIVRIDGEVHGDIVGVEKVVITKTGKVQGNIVGPRVTLEDGAKFKGSIDMDPGSAEGAGSGGASGQAPKSVPSSKPAAVADKPNEAAGKA
ncbi:MAG: polymer-forming cytoskeletal protein [Gammaproteobacteria bacterium]|jgi:cytoskeletal protein CcmA (bactofilin family)|nr:polymer-forming cytoskeletal protein [Gammaproteobacteria bacterium]